MSLVRQAQYYKSDSFPQKMREQQLEEADTENEGSLNSSIHLQKSGQMAFVKNAVKAVRDGRILNNDQLLQEIRVPDKIQRAIKVNTGRPLPEFEHHQLSSERLL